MSSPASRLAATLGAASVLAAAGGLPATAAAGTARIVTGDAPLTARPARASVVVTGSDGQARTLGPYRFRHVPTGLTSSPDGRYLVIGSDLEDQSREIVIVPTDGSGPFALRTVSRSLVVTSTSDFSWSADGSELIVGGTEDHRSPRGRWRFRSAALRCSITTRVCLRIPDSEGLAAAIPGGIVTTTPLDDVLPSGSQLGGWVEPTTIDARPARQSRYERQLVREVRTPERTGTTLVRTDLDPPTTTVLATRTSRLTRGTDAAVSMLGGPSGALIVHDHHRVAATRRGKKLRLRSRSGARRWTVVAPDGTRRTRPMRVFLVPKADAPTYDWGRKLPRQRIGVVPAVGIATGGWVGTVGFVRGAGPGGYLLARIAPDGAPRLVRTGGQLASARNLVRTVLGHTPTPGEASLDIVGYEAASDSVVVTLDWSEGPPDESIAPGGNVDPDGVVQSRGERVGGTATVRVPLDGAASSVVSRTKEHAAW